MQTQSEKKMWEKPVRISSPNVADAEIPGMLSDNHRKPHPSAEALRGRAQRTAEFLLWPFLVFKGMRAMRATKQS